MEHLLIESLSSIESEFRANELAYLALTTKIELPLRDRWAFALHQKLSDKYVVSREWRRTDLVVLEKSNPKALIELKALYSFDAALDKESIGGYIDAMDGDVIKAKNLATQTTDIYTVLLVTHPKSEVPSEYDGIIKYRAGINKALNKFSSSDAVKENAIEAIEMKFSRKHVAAKGILAGGEAFNISADVLFWFIKA